MDYELTANEGHHVAHNQALHSSFSHRANGLVISERGTNIFSAVDVTDESLKAMDRQESLFDVGADRLVQTWMNNVANATSQSGAADTESPVAVDNGVSEPSGSGSISQIITEVMGTLDDEAMTEGEVLKEAEINKALVAFMTCQGLPARFLSNVYSRHFFSILAPHWDMPSASTWETSILPSEASRVYQEVTAKLKQAQNHTLCFEGWSSQMPESIYTLTVTEAGRQSHFWKFHTVSSTKHAETYLAEILTRAIDEVGVDKFIAITGDNTGNTRLARKLVAKRYPTILNLPDPCHHLHNAIKNIVALEEFHTIIKSIENITSFFHKSYKATTELRTIQVEECGKTQSLEAIGKTRFTTVYWSARSVQRSWQSLERFGSSSGLDERFKSSIKDGGSNALSLLKPKSMARLHLMLDHLVDVLAPLAKSIHNLESSSVTVADVFLHWVAITASIKKLLEKDSTSMDPVFSTETAHSIVYIFNQRFQEMFEEGAGIDIYLTGFLLDPVLKNSRVLRGTDERVVTVGSDGVLKENDGPTVIRARKQLLSMLRADLDLRRIAGGKNRAESLLNQLSAYVRGFPPFDMVCSARTLAINWWKSLLEVPEAALLATYATKIFSVFPTSMMDERTASTMGCLNSPRRNQIRTSTIVANVQVREYQRVSLGLEKLPKPSHIRINFHDIDHDVVERKPTVRDIKAISEKLHETAGTSTDNEGSDIHPKEGQSDWVNNHGDDLSAIVRDIQNLAETLASEEEIEEMLEEGSVNDVPVGAEKSIESEIAVSQSQYAFEVEKLVDLDSKYLHSLFSGCENSELSEGASKSNLTEYGDIPDGDVWVPEDFM